MAYIAISLTVSVCLLPFVRKLLITWMDRKVREEVAEEWRTEDEE